MFRTILSQLRTSLTLLFLLSGSTFWLDIAFNVFIFDMQEE